MDVADMLSHDPPHPNHPSHAVDNAQQEPRRSHHYPTRHAVLSNNIALDSPRFSNPSTNDNSSNSNPHAGFHPDYSPATPAPKNVTFELLFDGAPHYRARLPMKVGINPRDTTEDIISTVKNFYGLYEGIAKGVSFEDDRGRTMIARYDNFWNDMIIYVKVIPECSPSWQSHDQIGNHAATPTSAQRTPYLDQGYEMPPPQPAQILNYGQPISRPDSRLARKHSVSPRRNRTRRSVSAQKNRSRSDHKGHEGSFQEHLDELNSDAMKGYGSSDGEAGSVTSSRKARNEQLASSEISLANVVPGGRRQKAKFESSELPLFVPPQVPAAHSISSISPQRRSNGQDNPSPFARPTQQHFSYNQPLQPQLSHGNGEYTYGIVGSNGNPVTAQPVAQHGHRLRDRATAPGLSTRPSARREPRAQGLGILPTPDPTVASCISDEDVALQLMRLGDASNISHGRTSGSAMDDTLSGRAEIASSATSDDNNDDEKVQQPSLPSRQSRPKLEASPALEWKMAKKDHKLNVGLLSMDSIEPGGDEIDDDYQYDGSRDGVFKSDLDDLVNEFGHPAKRPRLSESKPSQGVVTKGHKNPSQKNGQSSKSRQSGASKKTKPSMLSNLSKAPMSPASLPPQSRKTSAASTSTFPLGTGSLDEDLSTKPRCQRCRKSKKGCDRQRPCQRCQDAGIGADGCVSEDEGNGRKGRFGRHMGVAVKNDAQVHAPEHEAEEAGAILDGMATGQEKSKKRKR